jgi:hypothetical protein
MREGLQETVDHLINLVVRKDVAAARVRLVVDGYLAGFGPQTKHYRDKLADTFRDQVRGSEEADSVLKLINLEPS